MTEAQVPGALVVNGWTLLHCRIMYYYLLKA